MGTRGAICLVIDGQEKTVYSHWDSYPDALGVRVLTWIRDGLGDEAALRSQVGALTPVPDRQPTDEDAARLAEFHDPHVSTGKDWYALLRHTQGDLDAMLRAGLYEDASDFPRESLFCEWAYVVDFDARAFEVYEGFREQPPTEGRWVGHGTTDGYYPVQRIAAWSFDELPPVDVLHRLEEAPA